MHYIYNAQEIPKNTEYVRDMNNLCVALNLPVMTPASAPYTGNRKIWTDKNNFRYIQYYCIYLNCVVYYAAEQYSTQHRSDIQ